MVSAERLQSAEALVEGLRQAVHGQDMLGSMRNRVAAACYAIAQEHHHAIVTLIRHRLYASAFALLRIEFEACVRGLWLQDCASEKDVERFANGEEPPRIRELIEAVEEAAGCSEGYFSDIRQRFWGSMCGYTHTGGLHVQRWNTADAVEPAYAPQEVLEVLRFAELIAACSVIGLANLIGDDTLAQQVLALMPEL